MEDAEVKSNVENLQLYSDSHPFSLSTQTKHWLELLYIIQLTRSSTRNLTPDPYPKNTANQIAKKATITHIPYS